MPQLVSNAVPFQKPAFIRWPVFFAASGLAAAVAVSFWGTIGNPDCMDLDFGSYYRAASAVAQGRSPYFVDEHGPLGTYPYAPVFPFLLIPLAQLDYLWACRVGLLVNWLALAACCTLALHLMTARKVAELQPRPERERAGGVTKDELQQVERWRILGLALVPLTAYVWATLHVGQASLLVLLGCLVWATCRRQGWRFVGGLFLAIACALELAPGVFTLFLLLRRDVRGLAGVATGTALLFFAPAVWVGIDDAVSLHNEWIRHTAATQVPAQTFRPGNQSLLGQLARLPAISNGHEFYSQDNLAILCTLYPGLLAAAAGLAFGAMTWGRWPGGNTDWQRETWELALLFVFLTLAQPRGWRCNFVAMLLPCLLLARLVATRGRHWTVGALALASMTLACALPTYNLSEEGWSFPIWLLLGKHFWGALAVGAATWWCCRPSEPGIPVAQTHQIAEALERS